uniref:Uncharacterized protein n=1 Tax=Pylaiella littoralis TaxID=2885 RepID=O78799_PYLLI|nr:hypothetical protein PylioMp53 [Pylaiella littoralis]AAC23957.1 unknown [Pylaiella littoralis]CAC50863.1 hypothetical protein [Pylaiella littoralis]
MLFNYNTLSLTSSNFLFSSSVHSFNALRYLGTRTKKPKFQMDPQILDMFKNEEVMNPVTTTQALTNYLMTTNETSLTLFPRTETLLRTQREHHLNAIVKAIFTAGYRDVDFNKVIRVLKVVAIEFMTENDANDDPIRFTINFDHILSESELKKYQEFDYSDQDEVSPLLDADDLKEIKVYPELRQLFESQIIGPKNGKGNVHANNSVKYIKMIFLDVNNKKCRVDSILPPEKL